MTPVSPGQTLLTIAQIAKHYDLPESTARYYCKRFIDYLPHVGEGKRRRYRAEAMSIFAVILAEMKKSKDARSVEAVLASRFPKNVEATPLRPEAGPGAEVEAAPPAGYIPADPALITGLMKVQGKALSSIAAALTKLADRESDAEELKQELAETRKQAENLAREVEQLKKLQDTAEKVHQQDLEQLRTWLARMAQDRQGKE